MSSEKCFLSKLSKDGKALYNLLKEKEWVDDFMAIDLSIVNNLKIGPREFKVIRHRFKKPPLRI